MGCFQSKEPNTPISSNSLSFEPLKPMKLIKTKEQIIKEQKIKTIQQIFIDEYKKQNNI